MLGAETTVVLSEPFWGEPNSLDSTGSISKQGIGSIEEFCNFSPQFRLFLWCLARVFIFRGLDHSGAETAGMLNSAKARR